MEQHEQRFVIKYFWLKQWGCKAIHHELTSALGGSAYSLSQVKYWTRKFKNGQLDCLDEIRPGRPLSGLGTVLEDFLKQFPFATARIMARHFRLSPTTIKDILDRKLGFHKLSRRWVPHRLTSSQKAERADGARSLLAVLRMKQEDSFRGITTGDESWFLYAYQSDHMYVQSGSDVIPQERHTIWAKKI
jgi:hypothetical protein